MSDFGQTWQRVMNAELEVYRTALVEQLSRPLWLFGPQPDHSRRGWPRRYVLFPWMEAIHNRHLRLRWWKFERLIPAIDVLRNGLPEHD